jgi:hypothetical protein
MYALNINKGTEIYHPELGILESGVAIYIPDEYSHIAESLRGVITFHRIRDKIENSELNKNHSVEDK